MSQLERNDYKFITMPRIKQVPTFFAEMKLAEWTPSKIHSLADKFKVKWDNDPKFMALCKRLTGQSHLDKMQPTQLKTVADAITQGMH